MAMPNGRIRVYVKRKLELGRLTLDQQKMYKIGMIAVGTVKDRVKAGVNDQDAASKPLATRYAILKQKTLHKRPIRDLSLTGAMLDNFTVRTVSDHSAYANLTTNDLRTRARANNEIELWVSYSRKNIATIIPQATVLVNEALRAAIKSMPGTKP